MKEDSLSERLGKLKPKDKEPRSRSVLDSWIAKAEQELDPTRSGRLAGLSPQLCAQPSCKAYSTRKAGVASR